VIIIRMGYVAMMMATAMIQITLASAYLANNRRYIMNWIAYCIDCNKVLEDCPNGGFAKAAARLHHDGLGVWNHKEGMIAGVEGHRVIVGYLVPEEAQ
jgi:hypothetical protein